MSKETWHGWIVVKREEGYADQFFVEHRTESSRFTLRMSSPAEAVEWWDKKVGKPVKLLATPLGAYRVYTEEEE